MKRSLELRCSCGPLTPRYEMPRHKTLRHKTLRRSRKARRKRNMLDRFAFSRGIQGAI